MSLLPAPTLNQLEIRRSVKGKSAKAVRNALCTPYSGVWPQICASTQDAVLSELKKSLMGRDLRNPLAENVAFRRLNKANRKSKKEETLSASKQSPEEKNLRSQLVFGVTEITRQLERGQIRLVVVDRSSPWQLHRHLVQLSAVRCCPALALDRVSDTLSSLVSVTRLCAIGFKVLKDGDSDYFCQLVDVIVAHCPPIVLPWLDCENLLRQETRENEQIKEEIEQELNNREAEESSETTATEISTDSLLQNVIDYSHLYVKRSVEVCKNQVLEPVNIPRRKGPEDILSILPESTANGDDMWGIRKERLRVTQRIPIQHNAAKIFDRKGKQESSDVKKLKKSRKRFYGELNMAEIVPNAKKRKTKQ